MEWIIVIIVVVLLLFGAKKIPELARGMGKARAEFSRGQSMVEKEIRDAERLDREEEAKREREEARRRKEEEARARKEEEARARKEEEAKADSEDDVDDEEEDEVDPDVVKAAEALGIDPEGKNEEELKVLIKYKMEQG
jgi:sec-independent protein translocase protein TatA